MIPDRNDSNVSRQEFIDLLCRITKTDEDTTTNNDESNSHTTTVVDQRDGDMALAEQRTNIEEGEIITIDDDEDDDDDDDDDDGSKVNEIEDGELTQSQGSDVSIVFSQDLVESIDDQCRYRFVAYICVCVL
jgi:hypothetical protein